MNFTLDKHYFSNVKRILIKLFFLHKSLLAPHKDLHLKMTSSSNHLRTRFVSATVESHVARVINTMERHPTPQLAISKSRSFAYSACLGWARLTSLSVLTFLRVDRGFIWRIWGNHSRALSTFRRIFSILEFLAALNQYAFLWPQYILYTLCIRGCKNQQTRIMSPMFSVASFIPILSFFNCQLRSLG